VTNLFDEAFAATLVDTDMDGVGTGNLLANGSVAITHADDAVSFGRRLIGAVFDHCINATECPLPPSWLRDDNIVAAAATKTTAATTASVADSTDCCAKIGYIVRHGFHLLSQPGPTFPENLGLSLKVRRSASSNERVGS